GRRPRARHPPRDRQPRRREERPVRPVRDRAAPRAGPRPGPLGRRAQARPGRAAQAEDGVAAQVAGAGHGDARGRAPAHVPAPRRGGRPGVRRRDHRAERPLRPVPQEGHGLPDAAERGGHLHGHPRGGPGDLQAAQAWSRPVGDDPNSGKPIQVKDGRFGPYVTDGETNRTLPRDLTPETITPERAIELLAEKRAQGPAKKRTTRSTAKKAPAKKAPAKKSTRASSATSKRPART